MPDVPKAADSHVVNPFVWAVQVIAQCLGIHTSRTRRYRFKTILKLLACNFFMADITSCGTTGLQVAVVNS